MYVFVLYASLQKKTGRKGSRSRQIYMPVVVTLPGLMHFVVLSVCDGYFNNTSCLEERFSVCAYCCCSQMTVHSSSGKATSLLFQSIQRGRFRSSSVCTQGQSVFKHEWITRAPLSSHQSLTHTGIKLLPPLASERNVASENRDRRLATTC